AISLPQMERTFEHQAAVAPRAATPSLRPQPVHAVQPVGFPPPASPPAKVFLFGEPHVEAVVVPALPPVPATPQPSAWRTTPHSPPPHDAPCQVNSLPHRSQHAGSARRR